MFVLSQIGRPLARRLSSCAYLPLGPASSKLLPTSRTALIPPPALTPTPTPLLSRRLYSSQQSNDDDADLCRRQALGPIAERKLQLIFTCTVCQTRNTKTISALSYTKGVVIVRCDGCDNNHLIADNLNWFTDLNGKRNVEDILREKGETVRRLSLGEYVQETEAEQARKATANAEPAECGAPEATADDGAKLLDDGVKKETK